MLNNSKVMITPQQEMKDAIQQFECAENLFNNAPSDLIDYAIYNYNAAHERLNVIRRRSGQYAK
jgi:hypothetical protein